DWIDGIWPNEKVEYRDSPNDSYWDRQSNLDRIGARALWDVQTNGLTANGDTIVIAILEPNGFSPDHPDLKDNIWQNNKEIPEDGLDNDHNGYVDDLYGWNFEYGDDNHKPESYTHGTPVASLIGARGNNSIGISGVCWNIKLMLMSYTNEVADVIEAYEYILNQRKLYNQTGGKEGAFVVAANTSFGISRKFPVDFPFWCAIFDELGEQGILSVSATANAARDVAELGDMPTLCDSEYLITVTNLDVNDELYYIASYNPNSVDIAAPGENNYAAYPNNQYAEFGGTSAATPLVAGGIGQLYMMPCLKLFEVYQWSEQALFIKSIILDGVQKSNGLNNLVRAGGYLNLKQSGQLLESLCIDSTSDSLEISVFPNPTSDFINVYLAGEKSTFSEEKFIGKLIDQSGKLIWENQLKEILFSDSLLALDVSKLASGIYFLQVKSSSKVWTKKIVIR
ncbi:MAG: S8/S53 family peptidase, partial [Bacteroidota bacterium]